MDAEALSNLFTSWGPKIGLFMETTVGTEDRGLTKPWEGEPAEKILTAYPKR